MMDHMVVVDRDTCTGCGSCVKVCHQSCMKLVSGTVAVDHETCSTCGQCID